MRGLLVEQPGEQAAGWPDAGLPASARLAAEAVGDRIERAAQAAGVLGLVLRIEPRQHRAGALVDEMDEAEIPAGVADLDAREMAVTVGHLEAAARR